MEEKISYSKYICSGCRFKFKFKNETKMALKCPNCGKTNVVKDSFDLNKIINEF